MRRLFPAKGQKYLVASAKAQKHRNPVACCWPTQTCSYVEKVIHVDPCRTSWYSIGECEEASQALARADGLGLRAANMDGSGALGLLHYFRMRRLLLRSIQPTPRYSHMC